MKQFRVCRTALVLIALSATGGAHAQSQSDQLFKECRAAWAANNIGSADELRYRSLTAPDFKDVPLESRSQRIYNYAQLKRMLGNWDDAEELLRESIALEEQRVGDKPDLPFARRLAELSIALAAQGKWTEGIQVVERLLPLADGFTGNERAAVAELFRNYVPQVAGAGRVELAQKIEDYVENTAVPEPAFINK